MSGSVGWRRSVFALCAIVLMSTGSIPAGGAGSDDDGGIPSRYHINGRSIRGTVNCDGDQSLHHFIESIDAPGNGSAEDPFIIEGWDFNGSGGYNCIFLEELSHYLMIRNCTFIQSGIEEPYVRYGCGISIVNVENLSIEKCRIEDNIGQGIAIWYSTVAVRNNTVRENSGVGISVHDSNGDISNNTIFGNGDYGIKSYGDGVIYENNSLLHNGFYILRPVPSSNTINGRPPLFIEDDVNGSFTGEYGQVILWNCTGTTLHDMEINDTTTGIISGKDCRVLDCTISHCNEGIRYPEGNDIQRCTFIGNGVGIYSDYYREDFVCNSSDFILNDVAISANDFDTISNNIFASNGKCIDTFHVQDHDTVERIYHNRFQDTAGTVIEISTYMHNYDNITEIRNNWISNATVGMDLYGTFNITDNHIEDCTYTSILFNRMENDRSFYYLRRNELFGAGLSLDGTYHCVDIDRTTTLNDLTIAWVEGGSDLLFERPYYSQFIIIDSFDITIANQTLPTPREGIVIYGSQYVNVTNCTLMHGDVLSGSPHVRFSNCSIWTLELSYTPAVLVDNDFFGSINPRSSYIYDLEVRRNNFFIRPLMNDGDPSFDSFWDNYYSDYLSIYGNDSTSEDGVHWDILYRAWGINDSLARVYPFGYDGSRDPSIRSDRTPRAAFDGSNITFDVEVWDFIGIRNVSVRTRINGVNGTCELSRGQGYNWTGNISMPIASTDLVYTIRAQSITGHWANSSIRTVRVYDITPPALIDMTDPNGTTGDVFEFLANVTDNRIISSVWVEYWWKDVPPLYLEMDPEVYYRADLALPSYRIDPVFYRIRALDASDNGVSSETRMIAVTDNDKPVPVLPLLISTYVGRNVTLDASRSQDNIGIVRYRWDIKDVEGTVRVEGSRANYVFKFVGTFMVILMVQDAAGNAGWAVMYANVSDYPVKPQPDPPDTTEIHMTFGRVADSATHLPIEGVRVLMLMEGMYYLNTTDRFGYCSLLIPEPYGYTEVTITLRKEGYRNLTYASIISPEGYLRDIDPEMERSEIDPPEIPVAPPREREHDQGVPWLLVLMGFDLVLAILAAGLWSFLRMRYKKGGSI